MPYTTKWVKPEKLLRHKGIDVWCVYKDDDCENNGPREYHFTLDPCGSEEDENTFDVRDLSTWKAPEHPPFLNGDDDTPKNKKAWDYYHKAGVEEQAVKAAIRLAIEKGELKVPVGVESE